MWLPRHPLQDFLSVTDWNSVPVKSRPAAPPAPAPAPPSASCLRGCDPSGDLLWGASYRIRPFLTGLFHWVNCPPVSGLPSFPRLSDRRAHGPRSVSAPGGGHLRPGRRLGAPTSARVPAPNSLGIAARRGSASRMRLCLSRGAVTPLCSPALPHHAGCMLPGGAGGHRLLP